MSEDEEKRKYIQEQAVLRDAVLAVLETPGIFWRQITTSNGDIVTISLERAASSEVRAAK